MSFILDALRKSESERQRRTAPTLARAPLARPRREPPPWTLAVIALLSVLLVVLSAVWWQSTVPAPSDGSATAALVQSAPVEPRPAVAPVSSEPAAVVPSEQAPSGASSRSDPATAAHAPRPIGELALLDPSQPALRLELIAYHPDATRAYVVIDGSRYGIGDSIRSGPAIVEIRREGAVLGYRGETFLLRPR